MLFRSCHVKPGIQSDPYLIGFYDNRTLEISHDAPSQVSFRIEVDPTGNGTWMTYYKVNVQKGETYQHQFPESFEARWIRFTADKECKATTWLKYK